ncbi:hypothetical protein [Algibacillus agarilyticus]|uniref:hypothetical protein n=1 Tax=Algibacillus agarilyticus TaxID=2234133 RepID=UPI000DD0109C|nr:hypothetical protein [Algibacillus agarilyticus]
MNVSQYKTCLLLTLLLSACGGSDKKSTNHVVTSNNTQAITLEPYNTQNTLVENFPISDYISYTDHTSNLTAITSINTNWPQFNVYQARQTQGYIDASTEEMFYHAIEAVSEAQLKATDIERSATSTWYVNSDAQLYRVNHQNSSTDSWQWANNRQFTELALVNEDMLNVWLYDQQQHELVYFTPNTASATVYPIQSDLTIHGLSYFEQQLFVLAQASQAWFVMNLALSDTEVTYKKAWRLDGFNANMFTDVAILPDGAIVVSTNQTEHNLIQIADKSATLGDGPIPEAGELTLLTTISLDEQIEQPSGLWHRHDGNWLLLTDSAKLFMLDENFNIITPIEFAMASINCNQGCTEGVVATTDGFMVLTDSCLLAQFNQLGQFNSYAEQTELQSEHQLTLTDEQGIAYEYSGLAYDATTGLYYMLSSSHDENQTDQLLTLNNELTVIAQQPVTYHDETQGSIYRYDAQGIEYYAGHLYVISEQFTKLLKLNLQGEILTVYDLDHQLLAYPSDIAIHDNKIYLIGDHENDEPLPPVHVFEMID